MAIRYAVDLTDTERAALREIISKNKAKRSTIINAYILLKADRPCRWTNEDIASAYEVSTKKVEQLKKRFVQQLPLYPKDPIRPMSAGSLGAHFVPQESRLTPPAHRESKPGMLPWNFCPPLG